MSGAAAQDDLQLGYAVVHLGLAPLEAIRQCYQEFQRIGLPGSFGPYLLARKLVDEQGLARARERAKQARSMASGRWTAVTPGTGSVARPVSGRHERPVSGRHERPVSGRHERPAGKPPLDPGSTLDYGEVLAPAARAGGPRGQPPGGSPDRTLGFNDVLPSPAAAVATGAKPAPAAATSGAKWGAAAATPPRGPAAVAQASPDRTLAYDGVLQPEARTGAPAKEERAPKRAADPPADAREESSSRDVVQIANILAAPPLAPAAGDDYSQDELSQKLAQIEGLPAPERSLDMFGVLPELPPSRDAPSKDAPGEVADTRSGTGGDAPLAKAKPARKGKSVDLVADPEEEFFASGGAEEEIGAQPRVGDRLGDFELSAAIGQGGMGYVFEACRPEAPGKRYAVKVLQPGKGDHHRARRVRFQREVETLRQLDHPNLVRVYGCGRHQGWDWYAMDYVEGQDLSKLLAEHRLSPPQKLEVFEKVCEGMAHAHSLRVVHRDLKPSNIRVSPERDEVRVLDFGLAKNEDEAEALTQTGSALGTPFYMAPEQFKNAAHVDARADVWALGVMLYEMISGKRPFLGATAGEVVQKVLTVEPPRLRQLVPTVHADIEAICVKALEKDAKRRYPSAAELLQDLAQHRKGKGVSKAGAVGDARRWLDKHGTGFVVGVLVSSAVWGVALAWALLWR